MILGLALASTALVVLLPTKKAEGIPFWLTAYRHYEAYLPKIAAWNARHPDKQVAASLLHTRAFERRMLSGFLSETPLADLLESDVSVIPRAFLGPPEQIGFLDLTERLHAEGIYEQFNEPSFSFFTSRGRIYGLPHDVHPALLCYRADIVEAAGIDVSQIETWEDYFRVMQPLIQDLDGDGRPDRYLLEFSEYHTSEIIMLLLQNDGVLFDENDWPIFANERNAFTLATLTTWVTGPRRVTANTSGLGAHRQRLAGLVVGVIMPDWMLGYWKVENPQIGGKIKLMPLPAWEPGGRRTTVRGGTMIGINKKSPHIETCWEVMKYLYTSIEVAEQTYRDSSIISPVKALWDAPFYDEPDPFVCGQPSGRLYIEQAPHVPHRPSSPYNPVAEDYIGSVAMALRDYADEHRIYDVPRLQTEALRLLNEAQDGLRKLISRNVFLTEQRQQP
ncbi:hypothetical protein AXK11_05305 [Cephaloticoccus primus]|uniref:Sugar ABC transporter substrate-binding protein n=1 Tax=Cephaloticoccus primus TaxID=1548207 RepID=A0A139SNA6_9BACT|nr:extracellular solute-binding protein [Cephaloticoccus primus]KXU35941.1 hypothetical protein AXK11_05305 [Cephaloticoccus primus]